MRLSELLRLGAIADALSPLETEELADDVVTLEAIVQKAEVQTEKIAALEARIAELGVLVRGLLSSAYDPEKDYYCTMCLQKMRVR